MALFLAHLQGGSPAGSSEVGRASDAAFDLAECKRLD